MAVLTYNLNDTKNGGKVIAFNYSRSLNELVSSWNAQVAGGTFKAGNSISFDNVMTDGIISNAYKDNTGLWHIEGKDAGVKLMRSIPDIEDLPTGSARNVISYLASFCGINLVMNYDGLSGFNVRSVISGSTCAEAILELAMLSGCIAFIDNNGTLRVITPDNSNPSFTNIINDSGSSIDLDGYATQALINLTRRKWEDQDVTQQEYESTVGETPSTQPRRVVYNGTFSNGHYSLTMLEPFDVIAKAETTITENGITIKTVEEHDYNYKHKTIWRENQEYVLFAFIERGYTLTKTTEGTYSSNITFKETTTEAMTRSFAMYKVDGVPSDWEDDIEMIQSENITRSTVREGGKELAENMPAYSPPFDQQITRTYKRENFGKGLTCNETEITYEARQVGTISPVKVNGELVPHFLLNTPLAIQTHSTPEWVPVKTYRTYYEQYDSEGNCIISTHSEYSDDGAEWLTEHALSDTGDEELNEYQEAYAKFSQQSHGLEVSVGSSVISLPWQFIELQGRTKTTSNEEQGLVLGNISDWYDNGSYIESENCPHYNASTKKCNIYGIDATQSPYEKCFYTNINREYMWKKCARAKQALNLAIERDTAQLEAPIIGMATTKGELVKNPNVGYQRDIYVDDIISDADAQNIANTIAANILAVKSTKGIRKSVTIPYDPNFRPNGTIVEVAHDWANLQTTVTYRDEGNIPEYMISDSVSSIAAFVSTRENARQNIPKYGAVVSFSSGYVVVRIGNKNVSCTTKLKNLSIGSIVLVTFASGNKLRGQVIARL